MIVKYPHAVLNLESQSAKDNLSFSEIISFIDEMEENCWRVNGLGIACVQIGHPYRIFSMVDPNRKRFKYLIDPEITSLSGSETYNEGCLSIPGYYWPITRYSKVSISYTDVNNFKRSGTFTGIHARIIQHEMDHLDGILIPDLMSHEDAVAFDNYLEANHSVYMYDPPSIDVV